MSETQVKRKLTDIVVDLEWVLAELSSHADREQILEIVKQILDGEES